MKRMCDCNWIDGKIVQFCCDHADMDRLRNGQPLNYEAMLRKARQESDTEMGLRFGSSRPYHYETQRDSLVVRKFLEMAMPIRIDEVFRLEASLR